MAKRDFVFKAFLSLVIAISMTVVASANIISVNGSFETGDFTGWEQFPSGTQEVGGFDPTDGSFAARLFNDQLASSSVIKNANIGIGLVSPGDKINISFDARGVGNVGGVAFAEVFSEVDGGGTSDSAILGGGPLILDADPSVWTSYNFSYVAGPDVSGGISFQFASVTGGGQGSLMDLYVDNVVVSTAKIPEPSCAVLGFAGLAFLVRRRR